MTEDLFDWQAKGLPTPEPSHAFGGETYEPERDYERLTGQLGRVHELMRDGQWRTLAQIQKVTGGSVPAISARLRDLRKDKYGGWHVQRRYLHDGLFQYRVSKEAP